MPAPPAAPRRRGEPERRLQSALTVSPVETGEGGEMRRRRSVGAGRMLLLGWLIVAGGASAQEASEPVASAQQAPEQEARAADCTWLPDVRCGRSGRWDGFEKPIVQPYLFEDPFITTGAYPYYVWHEFPDRSALGGGDAHVVALQLRAAITDRLAFIATKDGYMFLRPESELLSNQDGWMNVAAGFKYALVSDEDERFLLSGILRAEFAVGSKDVLAGGSGVQIQPSLALAWEPVSRLHLIADLGGTIPTEGDQYSSSAWGHVYADYSVHRYFQPFVQLSGIYYVESGAGRRGVDLQNGPTIPLDTAQHVLRTGHFEGADVLNLGSRGVDSNFYGTWALGAHVPITERVTWSVAYERPFTDRKDVTKQRVTTAFTIEF